MIIIKRLSRLFILSLLVCVSLYAIAADDLPKVNKSGTAIVNNTKEDFTLTLFYDNKGPETVNLPVGITRDIDPDCYRIVFKNNFTQGDWKRPKIEKATESHTTAAEHKSPVENTEPAQTENAVNDQQVSQDISSAKESKRPYKPEEIIEEDYDFQHKGWQKRSTILNDFMEYLETHSYYSRTSIDDERTKVETCIEELAYGVANPKQYAKALQESIATMTHNLDKYRGDKGTLVGKFLDSYNNNASDKMFLRDSINSLIEKRLAQREENLNLLKNGLSEWEQDQPKHNWPLIGLIAAIAAICSGLIFWFLKARKRNPARRSKPYSSSVASASYPSKGNDIVVRRKTTSILKKQSLENVIDNPCYLAIKSSDFCPTSAVRRIYIKNTCIKDIYNMYAEDLRNPENPKEDGCMVLGRWVHDKENNEYYVSLEEVVMPGDDAVFSEYELNFGGKIKLKVSEKLRKLRRETDLQYDMTCWVHSHPGLGVFFSNQDNVVHMQLKHPTHPHFLTALVIDILTPEQELGIFTFKPDGTLNSKADLTQMYSLEDMYKWAIESERNTFKREDHFNTLAQCKQHEDICHGVHLSNSAIIDIDKLTVEHEKGMAGMVHGFIQQEGLYSEIAVSTVCQEERIPDNEPVGCFIITKYCSIPTVRKAIEPHAGKIRLALVYSTADGLLTTIPIKGKELMADETYYGEQKLEELKIWTRRRR